MSQQPLRGADADDGDLLREPPVMWSRRQILVRLLLLAAVGAVLLVLALRYRQVLTLEFLAEREADLAAWHRERPLVVYGAAFLLYVAITGLSLPGSLPLTLTYGWFFGFWRGLLLVSFASTAGATVAFLGSRYLFREFVQHRFAAQLVRVNEAIRREGAFYLFLLRLTFFVPYIVINPVMGLTPMRATTFWWVSQFGMLPATALYVWAASTVPTFRELAERGVRGLLDWKLFIALLLLGIFPLSVKKIAGRIRSWRRASA